MSDGGLRKTPNRLTVQSTDLLVAWPMLLVTVVSPLPPPLRPLEGVSKPKTEHPGTDVPTGKGRFRTSFRRTSAVDEVSLLGPSICTSPSSSSPLPRAIALFMHFKFNVHNVNEIKRVAVSLWWAGGLGIQILMKRLCSNVTRQPFTHKLTNSEAFGSQRRQSFGGSTHTHTTVKYLCATRLSVKVNCNS